MNLSSATYTGVFYPLQSFSIGKKVDWDELPILVESEDEEILQKLKKLAKSLTHQVFTVRSKDRKGLTSQLVFASNFSNHMIRIAEEIMRRQGLDFEMLKPLIIELFPRVFRSALKNAQTGPAIRADYETLEEHHQFLNYNEEIAEIYRLISPGHHR